MILWACGCFWFWLILDFCSHFTLKVTLGRINTIHYSSNGLQYSSTATTHTAVMWWETAGTIRNSEGRKGGDNCRVSCDSQHLSSHSCWVHQHTHTHTEIRQNTYRFYLRGRRTIQRETKAETREETGGAVNSSGMQEVKDSCSVSWNLIIREIFVSEVAWGQDFTIPLTREAVMAWIDLKLFLLRFTCCLCVSWQVEGKEDAFSPNYIINTAENTESRCY